jgi:hypothetical protein
VQLVTYALADQMAFAERDGLEARLDDCRDAALADRVRLLSEVAESLALTPVSFAAVDSSYDVPDDGLVHLGCLEPWESDRQLEQLMEAVRRLDPRDRRQVRVHVFATGWERLRLDVTRQGLSDVFVLRPLIPLLEFLSLTDRLDVVLLSEAGEVRRLVSSVPSAPQVWSREDGDEVGPRLRALLAGVGAGAALRS